MFNDPLPFGTVVYFLSEWAVRLVMLFWVPMRRSPEAAKGWLLLIFILPWPGLLLYGLIGRPYVPRFRKERFRKLRKALQPIAQRLAENPQIFHPKMAADLEASVLLAERIGKLPILGGNAVQFLPDYDSSLFKLAADIDTARDHVHLMYYIFCADEATEPVVAALERAAARGVACRVLADALGSRKSHGPLFKRLRAAGVACHTMLDASLLRPGRGRTDLRNHRKLAIIDGCIGHAGSQNLVRADFKQGITNVEMVARVTGPVVVALQFVFAGDWYLESEEMIDEPRYFPEPLLAGEVAVQVLASGPMFAPQGNQRLLVTLLHGARERVVITTPYFIPDEPLFTAIKIAVLRGVKVHLILSKQEDQFLVARAQQSYYEELLDAGVKIHLFYGGFLHAKYVTIDDEAAFIGSSNLDIRSFVLNAEISLIVYDHESARALQREQEKYIQLSVLLTPDVWARRSLLTKYTQNVARLMSPLL